MLNSAKFYVQHFLIGGHFTWWCYTLSLSMPLPGQEAEEEGHFLFIVLLPIVKMILGPKF